MDIIIFFILQSQSLSLDHHVKSNNILSATYKNGRITMIIFNQYGLISQKIASVMRGKNKGKNNLAIHSNL